MSQSVTILGLGWLGKPLAKALADEGYHVKGSVRRERHQQKLDGQYDIDVIRLRLKEEEDQLPSFFAHTDIAVLTIPAKESYDAVITALAQHSLDQIIFCSTTSVYTATEGEVDEHARVNENSPYIEVENALKEAFGDKVTIIRFAGLMGYDRQLIKYIKKGIRSPHAPVNHIHRDDAVGIIKAVINQKLKGSVINAVAPKHPTKMEILHTFSSTYKIPLFGLQFLDDASNKIVRSSTALEYAYMHSNPALF
jgi:nucleoside-diphosphate-sugar epimerase